MPLSNYLPSSRLIQPGVCTSSTRPASPFEGQVIYETDTDKTYVWNGSAWIMQISADAPPGLQLIKTQAVGSTPVTSVTVTGAFSSDFDNYLVLVNGCQASQTDQLQLRFGARTTGYKWGLVYNAYNNTPSSLGNGNDTHIKYLQGFTSTAKFDAIIPIRSPYLAAPTIVGPCGYSDTGANGVSNAYDDSTTQYTSFILSPASGTLTGGTIRVYGYRN